MPNRHARLLPTVLAAQGAYYQRVVSLVGQSSIVAYYPKRTGTTLTDIINARNGTVTNSSDATGIGDGLAAWAVTGTGYGNLDAIAASLNGLEGTFMAWVKVSAAADWTDAAYHVVNRHLYDADNVFSIAKDGAVSNRMYFAYEGGNVNTSPSLTSISNTGWFNVGGVWSQSGQNVSFLYNGARHYPYTSVGTWSGTPGTNAFASNAEGSASVAWKGSLAHFLYLNRALTEAESCALVDLAGVGVKTIALLGDSIVGFVTPFQSAVLGSYNGGNARVRNHGATGSTILTHMAGQVTAAAGDNARMVIVELGVNDNDAGNMTTLQATAEAQIAILKTNHPSATVYWLNVLPCWTDNTTGPELAKGNIRAAVAAACTAQSVTCWDTYTDPWITQAQTSDGIHPTAAGHTAIAARINALLA